jgi:hypothetical protein
MVFLFPIIQVYGAQGWNLIGLLAGLTAAAILYIRFARLTKS